jgi:methylenetetrahydrofolate reductase (NADPH)
MVTTKMEKDFIELVTPKHNTPDFEGDMEKFAGRYQLFSENHMVICIPDNPMSNISYMGTEMIEALELPVAPENLLLHLNTFHRKTEEKYDPGKDQNEQDFNILVEHAAALGIKYLLCVSGDGSERLHRLQPEDLGYDPAKVKTVTSVQLLEYLNRAYPGVFTMGVAFNHYEPFAAEMEKLQQKIAAGAAFIITQPVILFESGDPALTMANRNLREMLKYADDQGIQVILGAWISAKLAYLIPECIGYDVDFGNFSPDENLRAIRETYPERRLYYSMIFTAQRLQEVQAIARQEDSGGSFTNR